MIDLIDKKEIKKANEELILLHKRVLLNYLIQQDLSHKNRKRFFIIYDTYIKPGNIRSYFHIPIRVFVRCLILDRLEDIRSFARYSRKANKLSKKTRSKII